MVHLPPKLINKFEMYIDSKTNHIHLLDLGSNRLSIKKIQLAIEEICKRSNIISIDWNWIVYGHGQVNRVSNILFPLHYQDETLYTPFRKRMFIASPLRGI
ncbi:hypothetical protein [Cytobacillus praedii]|uniref:hypothetical protein n=1 Tax=Cytobacillus praedii TaxID=1742358 RepID=UPI002E1CE6C2|nr:hypothetical protein [Cytobacillus praedii]